MASVAKVQVALTEVRRILRSRREVRYGLIFPARLRITHSEVDKEFDDQEKNMVYVKNSIISATGRGREKIVGLASLNHHSFQVVLT